MDRIYRCDACGNKTRFDVIERKRVKSFHHFTLGGELSVEDEEVLERVVERVVCRWCGSSDSITEEPLLYAAPDDQGSGVEPGT